MSRSRWTVRTGLALALWVSPLRAQVTESPVAFDSAGRIRTVTPALVARLALQPPVWPVLGAFREARLFASSAGGHVLAVERMTGAFERFVLTDDATAELRSAMDAAMSRTGALVTEERSDIISEPARGAFVRNQMLMTWSVYGPLLSYMAGEGRLAAAAYLLATGASYFITNEAADREQVTRAQNHLTTDAAWRGSALGAGTLWVIAGDGPSGKAFATAALTGGLGTAFAGFRRGRRLTDAEAEATTTFSTLGAATTFLTLGAVGALSDSGPTRAVVAPILAAAAAGYALGPRYARRTTYGVTRGDVQVLKLGSALGVMVALTPFVGDVDVDEKVVFGATTAGLVGGALVAHARWVRPYEHSAADAGQVTLGAFAGGLLGTGLGVLTSASAQASFAMVTAGAIFGSAAGHGIADPPRAGARRQAAAPGDGSDPRSRRVQVHPSSLALAAAGVPGRHAGLTIRF